MAALDAEKCLLVELRRQVEQLMLSQYVRDFIHNAIRVVRILCSLFQALFQGVKDALALTLLFHCQVQVGQLEIELVKLL